MTRQNINGLRAVEPEACLTVQEHIEQIALARQGVSEHEANVLRRVLERLERISEICGTQAAHRAALVVKTIWLGENVPADALPPTEG